MRVTITAGESVERQLPCVGRTPGRPSAVQSGGSSDVSFDRGTQRALFACRCNSMDFSNNGLGLAGVRGLIEALKNNDSLETLNLGTNSIGDEGAEALATYMAGQPVVCPPAHAFGLLSLDLPNTGRHMSQGRCRQGLARRFVVRLSCLSHCWSNKRLCSLCCR